MSALTNHQIDKLIEDCDRKIKDAVYGGGTWQFLTRVAVALGYLKVLHANPGTCGEENDLAHGIAEESARELIESASFYEEIDGVKYIDTNQKALENETVADAFEDELHYLDLREMLKRHPQRPNLICILEN